MKVFLSWSGPKSKAVAENLASWMRQVVQAVEPWISSEIDKGARWGPEIAERLEQAKVGIICLTRDNLEARWILFEAGALSKTKDAYVCTFLLGLSPSDVGDPLGQFQHTLAEETDVRRLMHTINRAVQTVGDRALPENDLNDIFDVFWPRLRVALAEISAFEEPEGPPPRTDREVLDEILEILRSEKRGRALDQAFRNYVVHFSSLRKDRSVEEKLRQLALQTLLSREHLSKDQAKFFEDYTMHWDLLEPPKDREQEDDKQSFEGLAKETK